MKECLFCKIIEGKVPADKIYEDRHALAFLDVFPRSPGHTLVIPKSHAEKLEDLPEIELQPLFSAVAKVSGIVLGALKAEGATIGINQGKVAGQVVEHLHVHMVPRFAGDKGGSLQSVVNNAPEESTAAIRKKILKIK